MNKYNKITKDLEGQLRKRFQLLSENMPFEVKQSFDEVMKNVRSDIKLFNSDAPFANSALKVHLPVILLSQKGCTQQRPHLDFTDDKIEDLEIKPFGVIVAIEDNTKIVVFSEQGETKPRTTRTLIQSIVSIEKYNIFVFAADLIHAGAEYNRPNIRLHWYLATDERHVPINKITVLQEGTYSIVTV